MSGALVTFVCPRCGKSCDSAMALDGRDVRPKPGDLTVCFGCAAPLEFGDAAMPPRWLTFEDFGRLESKARQSLAMCIIGIVTFRWREPQ